VKVRLDQLLVSRGLFDSREKAQRAILAGEIFADGQRADKAGARFEDAVPLEVAARPPYVSRGGQKLEAALDHFAVDPAGQVCVDIGASTGGFTDCLLQRGAAKVYALDVGHGQLDWKIRSDPRVIVREKLNARNLTPADVPEPASIAVVDVSFISLTLILPPLCAVLDHGPGRAVIALIKPQFELERTDISKGGIVRDAGLHERAVEKVRLFAGERLGNWRWTGVIESPILGTQGNKEFLACLRS
jgi:23S rRNA (cytidine1920-2'-O)/16S rRNA (cytidine1409-2'-O)-methyltransferase